MLDLFDKKQAVIFDMDGTLIDSMRLWDEAPLQYLRDRGKVPKEDLLQKLETMTVIEGAMFLKQEYDLEDAPDRINLDIVKTVEKGYESVPLKPGVKEFLEACMAGKLRMCVVTTTPERQARKVLSRLGVLNNFYFIMDCEMIPGGKQRPDAYQMASHRLAASPQATVVIEDAYYAMKTAKAARYTVIAVKDASEKASREEIQEVCDYYAESMEELI